MYLLLVGLIYNRLNYQKGVDQVPTFNLIKLFVAGRITEKELREKMQNNK